MTDLYEFLFYLRLAFVHICGVILFANVALATDTMAWIICAWIVAAGLTGYVFIYLYEVFYLTFVYLKILIRITRYKVKKIWKERYAKTRSPHN